eukprot:m.1653299 g.1653299  ORF g.1653299 m.1653299 type:complete len:56 (-) comp96555_c0_seq1:62-229(-)
MHTASYIHAGIDKIRSIHTTWIACMNAQRERYFSSALIGENLLEFMKQCSKTIHF